MTEDNTNSQTEHVALSEVKREIEKVKKEILAEDKLGASRNDVVEGTCKRITRRLDEGGQSNE